MFLLLQCLFSHYIFFVLLVISSFVCGRLVLQSFLFSSLKSILKFITRLSNKLLYKKPSNNMNQHSFAYNSSISVEPGPKHLYSSTLQYVFQTMYLQFYIMKKVSIPPVIPYTQGILVWYKDHLAIKSLNFVQPYVFEKTLANNPKNVLENLLIVT